MEINCAHIDFSKITLHLRLNISILALADFLFNISRTQQADFLIRRLHISVNKRSRKPKNGQTRITGNIEYTRQRTNTNKTKNKT
jgi:hypothetical protein